MGAIDLSGWDIAYHYDKELPICRHDNGVERSAFHPGWVCVDCGDFRFGDDTPAAKVANAWLSLNVSDYYQETVIIGQNGKGDHDRVTDKDAFDQHFESIYGPVRKHVCRQWTKFPDGTSRCYFCGELRTNISDD